MKLTTDFQNIVQTSPWGSAWSVKDLPYVRKPLLLKKRVLIPSFSIFSLLLTMTVYLVPDSQVNSAVGTPKPAPQAATPALSATKAVDNQRLALEIESFIKSINPAKPVAERRTLVKAIIRESARLHIPARLKIDGRPVNAAHFLTALIRVESTFHRKAISRANARGYMQLMIPTAKWMDYRFGTKTSVSQLFNADINVARGVSYLNLLFKEFKNARLVCLAYNAGPGSVKRGFYVERYWTKIHTTYRELQNRQNQTIAQL